MLRSRDRPGLAGNAISFEVFQSRCAVIKQITRHVVDENSRADQLEKGEPFALLQEKMGRINKHTLFSILNDYFYLNSEQHINLLLQKASNATICAVNTTQVD